MYFFTSDTHFGHANILRYCKRPFSHIDEMDEVIIKNYNDVVTNDDIVFHHGDFAFRDPVYYRKRLNGKIFFINGNHDYKIEHCKNIFESVHDLLTTKVENQQITMCHFAMRVWNKSHFNTWHTYGHSHGRLESFGKSYDVGVDNNDFKPVSFEQLKEIMKNLPDNFNVLKKFEGYDEKEFLNVKRQFESGIEVD